MLSIQHPLSTFLQRVRWRNTNAEHPTTEEESELRMLILRLETGLFERLPQIVIATVCRYGTTLNENLDSLIVEIARCVANDTPISEELMASFRFRLERYYDVPSTPIFGSGTTEGCTFKPYPLPG